MGTARVTRSATGGHLSFTAERKAAMVASCLAFVLCGFFLFLNSFFAIHAEAIGVGGLAAGVHAGTAARAGVRALPLRCCCLALPPPPGCAHARMPAPWWGQAGGGDEDSAWGRASGEGSRCGQDAHRGRSGAHRACERAFGLAAPAAARGLVPARSASTTRARCDWCRLPAACPADGTGWRAARVCVCERAVRPFSRCPCAPSLLDFRLPDVLPPRAVLGPGPSRRGLLRRTRPTSSAARLPCRWLRRAPPSRTAGLTNCTPTTTPSAM